MSYELQLIIIPRKIPVIYVINIPEGVLIWNIKHKSLHT